MPSDVFDMYYFSTSLLNVLRAIEGYSLDSTNSSKLQITEFINSYLLNFLSINKIGKIDNDTITFQKHDRLKIALFAVQHGIPINEVSKYLNWKDFETLTSEILSLKGFSIQKNLRFKKPRMEIDVVGYNSILAIVVDCKHWKYNNNSMLRQFALKQVERAKRLIEENRKIKRSIPLLVTLYSPSIKFIEKIPVVPISCFNGFINELEENLDDVLVLYNS